MASLARSTFPGYSFPNRAAIIEKSLDVCRGPNATEPEKIAIAPRASRGPPASNF